MTRNVFWSIWLSSGLLILIILGGIVKIMVQPSESIMEAKPRFDAEDTISSTTQRPVVDEGVQEVIKMLSIRRGYSNPHPSSEEDDSQNITRRPKRTRRPLRLIGKDFNPHQSYTYRHSNGTLTYVFPSQNVSSTTVSSFNTFDDKSSPTTVIDRKGSEEPVATYPEDLIDGIMEKHKVNFEGAFGNDLINGDILNSRSDIPSDDFFCATEERLIHPTDGLTVKNLSVWIVNTKSHQQGVRIEKCVNEGKPCRFCDGNTVCKQMFHYRTLVTVNPNTNKPSKEFIQFPSCCKCTRIPY